MNVAAVVGLAVLSLLLNQAGRINEAGQNKASLGECMQMSSLRESA